MAKILLTGGAGYVGSHIAVCAIEAGHEVVILDNYCNSQAGIAGRLSHITGKTPVVVEGDVRDTGLVKDVISEHGVSDVIHLAGLKSVEESIDKRERYFDNNVEGTNSLIDAMAQANIFRMVFSSSATVYGEPEYLPLDEIHRLESANPYADTKIAAEQILEKRCLGDVRWKIVSLRYFNPVGAHGSGLLGDNPVAKRANLMPMIARVVMGQQGDLEIYGDDYDTPDGTCLRDYIHIMDLAEGHLSALRFMDKSSGFDVFNLGTGYGVSVLELVNAFRKVSGEEVPYRISPRRDGDAPASYANCDKAAVILGWKAKRSLLEMCESTWRWCEANSSDKQEVG